MRKLFGRIGRRTVVSTLGIVVALLWFSLSGGGGIEAEQLDRLPDTVFGGGGGTLTVELESEQRSRLLATFERYLDDGSPGTSESVHVEQAIAAGRQRLAVDVSDRTYVYLQFDVEQPEIGARIRWTIRLGEEAVLSESEVLDQPLRPGHAFFLNFEADDIAQVREFLRH